MSRIIFTFESLNFLHLLCDTLIALLFLRFVHFPRNIFLVVQLPVKTCFFCEYYSDEPCTLLSGEIWNPIVCRLVCDIQGSCYFLFSVFLQDTWSKDLNIPCPYLLCLLVFLWSGKFVMIRLIFMISRIN